MSMLNLRRMKQRRISRSYTFEIPTMLILQAMHDDHEFLERSI